MTAVATTNRNRELLLEKAQQIDEIAGSALELFKEKGSFARELALAQAMTDLRAMLTQEVMQPVMALMNTDIGFRTDRDPSVPDREGRRPTPYSVEVVRDVLIESKLRGFHTCGNEFNIIAGRFYAAKNGFRRKLTDGKTFPGLSNFKDHYDVPRMAGDKGAIVKARAEWMINGAKDSIECEIPVKANAFMGADGILGKAERKLLKRVVDRLSGVITPEGDVGDVSDSVTPPIETQATPVHSHDRDPRTPDPEPDAPEGEPVMGPQTPPPAAKPKTASAWNAPMEELAAFCGTAGIKFDEFQRWGVSSGNAPQADSWASFEDVPPALATRLMRNKAGMRTQIEAARGGAQ